MTDEDNLDDDNQLNLSSSEDEELNTKFSDMISAASDLSNDPASVDAAKSESEEEDEKCSNCSICACRNNVKIDETCHCSCHNPNYREIFLVDESDLDKKFSDCSPYELECYAKDSAILKAKGNKLYREAKVEDALQVYTEALAECPLIEEYKRDRSILFANCAACFSRLENYEDSTKATTKALELNPSYLKARLRRADALERLEKLEEALNDYQEILKYDPTNLVAREACSRLPEEINVRNEKLKTEMMSKLKDLGNMCLKPFGLSTDNFKVTQDPGSGSYSINFQR